MDEGVTHTGSLRCSNVDWNPRAMGVDTGQYDGVGLLLS